MNALVQEPSAFAPENCLQMLGVFSLIAKAVIRQDRLCAQLDIDCVIAGEKNGLSKECAQYRTGQWQVCG
jgi:hypothetical protein